jgi:hypothetical protein
MIILINMNQKLLFVSIIAIVAAFGVSAIASGIQSNPVFAKADCQQHGTVNVGVACNTQVCNTNILSTFSDQKCDNK